MKFCLKQKIVTNLPPTDGIEKVSGVTEYEALRAEKLFRYEYSNQLNTNLLTFSFTVYTAGLALFALIFEFSDFFTTTNSNTISNKDVYSVFVEYFFACFFLLPCFFARINFLYTVNNSLRIGQLTEYTREKILFDDGESWESFKREYKVNYFYRKGSGVGGAKEIPFWINIISQSISLAVGILGIYVLIQNNADFQYFSETITKIVFIRIFLSIGIEIYCQITTRYIKKRYYFFMFLVNLLITYALSMQGKIDVYLKANSESFPCFLIVLVWVELLQLCIFITPQYDREIMLANSVLEYTKAALEYSKDHVSTEETMIKRSKAIFLIFLDKSSVLEKYRDKYSNKTEKIVKQCMPIYKQIDINAKCFEHSTKESLLQEYLNGEKSR